MEVNKEIKKTSSIKKLKKTSSSFFQTGESSTREQRIMMINYDDDRGVVESTKRLSLTQQELRWYAGIRGEIADRNAQLDPSLCLGMPSAQKRYV